MDGINGFVGPGTHDTPKVCIGVPVATRYVGINVVGQSVDGPEQTKHGVFEPRTRGTNATAVPVAGGIGTAPGSGGAKRTRFVAGIPGTRTRAGTVDGASSRPPSTDQPYP